MSDTNVPYDAYLDALESKFSSFVFEAKAGKTNKSAALRARKVSMELRNDLKDFRTVSIDNDTANTRTRGDAAGDTVTVGDTEVAVTDA